MPRMRLRGVVWTAMIAATALPAWGAVVLADSRDDSLAATTAAPWNPPGPIPARRGWEEAINFPGRVASLPFVALGAVTRNLLSGMEDRGILRPRPLSAPGESAKPTRPFGLQFPHLGDHAGLGGGVVVHTPAPAGRAPALSLGYAATLHFYNRTLAGVAYGPLALQYGYDWRPQMQFFGLGRGSSKDQATDYASQDEFVRASATFTFPRDTVRGAPHGDLRMWAGPRSEVTRRGREGGLASYEVLFPALGTATLDRREESFVYGAGMTFDARSGTPHWSRGGRLRIDAERRDAPVHALALHSAEDPGASATRVIADAEAGFSFRRDPRTVRLRVTVTDLTLDRGSDHFLFADLSRLGGHEGLAGFTSGRFVDQDALLTRATYVFPLSRLFEAEVHGEWGSVYHDVWREASLGSLEHSFGFNVRGRSETAPHGAVGLDFSREGVRIHYAWGGVE